MAWNAFHNRIDVVANGATRSLPVDQLTVTAVPFSRSGGTAVELFDGRIVQRVDGYRVRVELAWNELTEAHGAELRRALSDLVQAGGGVVDLDPGAAVAKQVEVVVEDASECLRATFDGSVRGRPASISMVAKTITTTTPSWII